MSDEDLTKSDREVLELVSGEGTPSVAYISWKLNYEKEEVENTLQKLRDMEKIDQ